MGERRGKARSLSYYALPCSSKMQLVVEERKWEQVESAIARVPGQVGVLI